MKYSINNSCSNIAWFKLQDSLNRNEHEKAFNTYKLLAHSFKDDAFKFQTKGDLHLFFNEKDEAMACYKIALNKNILNDNKYGINIIELRIINNFENKESEFIKNIHNLDFIIPESTRFKNSI